MKNIEKTYLLKKDDEDYKEVSAREYALAEVEAGFNTSPEYGPKTNTFTTQKISGKVVVA